jgi:hypothetical protein
MPKRLTWTQLPWSGRFEKRNLYQQPRSTMQKYFSFFKILKFQNFENSKKMWAPIFGPLLGLRSEFWNCFVVRGLTTFLHCDDSTISFESFFTVKPKCLTTSTKCRVENSRYNTHDPCGIAFPCHQNTKKRHWQEVMFTWADCLKTRLESHFQDTKI